MLIAKHKSRLFIAIAIICAAVAFWSINENGNSSSSQQKSPSQDEIDFFITNGELKTFSKNGQLTQQTKSTKVEHFKQRQVTQISAPNIKQFDNNQLSATVTSQNAVAQDVSQIITFNDNVIATSFKESQKHIQLKTPSLQYDRKKNTLSTDQDVEFTDTLGNITSARGMHADIGLKKVHLKTNVKGTFNEK